MKKNKMMRLASSLLVAVLLTSSVISGTFAKYVTSGNANDTARVAKWGVKVAVTGDAFKEDYDMDDTNGYFTYSVESSTTDKVVAPGTTGTFGGVAVTGTPEVAVQVTNEATLTLNGSWSVDVSGTDKFYCPIIINVNGTDISGLNYASATAFAAAVESAIEAANGQYEANRDLSAVANLNGSYTWRWEFSGVTGSEINQTDTYDTALGDAAVLGNITISLNVVTTVTQID